MTYMELIREYARICNVDVQDMLNHIQRDRFAEIQFLDWLKRVGEAAIPDFISSPILDGGKDMTKSFISFDVSAFDWFLNDAGQQYEKSSPTVETWLDQVADRLRDGSVTIRELRLVDSLLENGIWLDPHGAGNLAYKAMSEFGALPSNVTIAF